MTKLPLPVRWAALFAAFAVLSAFIYGIGLYVVPHTSAFDHAISNVLNPDQYLAGFDELFRAITDYTNPLISLPVISLAIAIGICRLATMPPKRAFLWGLLSSGLWALTMRFLHDPLDLSVNEALAFAAAAPALLLIGTIPPRVFPALSANRWVSILLALEFAVFLGMWLTHRLWWNPGLVGANYVFLLGLVSAFGGMVFAFTRMDHAAQGRYARVFWLVLLSIVLTDMLATETIKKKVARPRPLSTKNADWNAGLRPIPTETLRGDNSFPSGHTSGTFALLTPFFWWVRDRRARAGILLWAVLQGVSRVYTVAHFTTDCLAGALLGFGTASLVFFLLGGPNLRAPEKQAA